MNHLRMKPLINYLRLTQILVSVSLISKRKVLSAETIWKKGYVHMERGASLLMEQKNSDVTQTATQHTKLKHAMHSSKKVTAYMENAATFCIKQVPNSNKPRKSINTETSCIQLNYKKVKFQIKLSQL